MKHTPFWSETGGLGALTPACGAQVGYPGYPVDIRIGNLSPSISAFPLSQNGCRSATVTTQYYP